MTADNDGDYVDGAEPFGKLVQRLNQERPRPARGIEDAELRHFPGRLVLHEFADRMLHDIFNDVLWRVENTAGFLHFGLVLDLCLMPVRKPDHFAEELLVHVPENSRRDKRKLVLAVGEV